MTDVATGFLQSISAFGATRLGKASATTFQDAGSLMSSLTDGVPDNTKPAFDQLKADIEADGDLIKPIKAKIKKQTDLIAKMATESIADANAGDFTAAEAGRIATRIGTALLAIDEAVNIIATELARDAGGTVNTTQRDDLMGIWNPWVQPFKDLSGGAGKLLDSLGEQVLGLAEHHEEPRRRADVRPREVPAGRIARVRLGDELRGHAPQRDTARGVLRVRSSGVRQPVRGAEARPGRARRQVVARRRGSVRPPDLHHHQARSAERPAAEEGDAGLG